MRENDFQKKLKEELEDRFPGCVILKNDPEFFQGIPDLLILYEDKWAMLECKANRKSSYRPNQDIYIEMFDSMSFCRAIYPENKEEVLDELQYAFGS